MVESVYETYPVVMGVYKHHEGSSSSRSGRSWIEEIRRAWGLKSNDRIECAAAGCRHDSSTHRFEGCHLSESILKEILSIVGFGGTPVVALCSSCHDKRGGAIMIGNIGMGIIDTDCPVDILPASTTLDEDAHILCRTCGTMDTKGPEDEEWYCSTCNHHIDAYGYCSTHRCCTDIDFEWYYEDKCGCTSEHKKHLNSPDGICRNKYNHQCGNGMCGYCCGHSGGCSIHRQHSVKTTDGKSPSARRRSRRRWLEYQKRQHRSHSSYDEGESHGGQRLGFHAECNACGHIAVGRDINADFGFNNHRPRPRCKDCRKKGRLG